VHLCSSKEEAVSLLVNETQGGDVVLTLGAGDVHLVGTELLKALSK
jgi:UDP-N-acetylmuramate-alanine ligase